MALVLLRAYSTSVERDVALSFLHSHGIRTFRFDPEHYGSTVADAGIPSRLMIAEEDLEEASAVLDAVENPR